MYSIKTGSWLLYHPLSDRIAISAKITDEINTHGSLDMTLDDPQNLFLRSPVEVYDEDGMIWRGRVLDMENGFTDTRKVIHCEGALAFLCDSILPPFTWRNGTPAQFFTALINNHNLHFDTGDPRIFTVGTVNVTDPGGNIFRSSETPMNTWEAIKTRLLDLCGGYIYLSGENLDVINYVSDFSVCDQTIRFGENIISLIQADDAQNIVTAIYAYGATNDQEHTEPEPTGSGLQLWYGNRVHTSDLVVYYQTAIDRWGYVYGTKTFDDCTTAEGLLTAAYNWLAQNYASLIQSLDISAADLSLSDVTIDTLEVGKYVRVICDPLMLDVVLVCMRKETDLLDPSQTRVAIGRVPTTISGIVGGKI